MTETEIDWDKADEWDADAAHDELEAHVAEVAAGNADVRRFLTIQAERFETVTISGAAGSVDIRVVAVVPWSVRTRIAQIAADAKQMARREAAGEEVETPDPITAQRPMYEVLADLCLDAPWNDWKTWAGIDVRTGAAPDMLERILSTVLPQEDRIKSFRAKR